MDSKDAKFSVRWSAPEVLRSRKYSKASDVWSYGRELRFHVDCISVGVVLWEIIECSLPYPELDDKELFQKVGHEGVKLPSPTKMEIPAALQNMMKQCFELDAENRPSFQQVCP